MNFYRYKITIEYLGTGLAGWQRQKNALSVQELLEEGIYKFSGEKVIVYGAGRTDSGVHALGQVAHFDLSKNIDPNRVRAAINYFVRPYAVGVIECILVDNNFHARFSAIKRHYTYKIINRSSQLIVDFNRAWWVRHCLDIELMNKGASYLIGNHDFSSFRSTSCQAKSAVKTLSQLIITQEKEIITCYFAAPSFLHNMVRNIVGTLVLVGRKVWQPEQIKSSLEAKKREATGVKAPAYGLYFLKVDY